MPIDLTQSSIVRHYMDEAAAEARLRGMLELRFGQAGADADEDLIAQLATLDDPASVISRASSLDDLRP